MLTWISKTGLGFGNGQNFLKKNVAATAADAMGFWNQTLKCQILLPK